MNPIAQKDREILRKLAARVREISMLPEQEEHRKLLYDLNSLKSQRPAVLAFPEGAWQELIPDSTLQCENTEARQWEFDLRSAIYQWENIKDDSVVEPFLNIKWKIDEGNFGVPITYSHGANRGSYTWEAPVKDLNKDMAKLRFRQPSVDRALTLGSLDRAQEILGDLITPRIRGMLFWTNGLTWTAVELLGLENFMVFMMTEPDALHRFMAWLRDEQLNFISWCETEGLLTPNNQADYVGSGGYGYTNELPVSGAEKVMLKDMWGLAESQETVGTGADLFGEFIFPYQLPIISKFGLACYGCCEGVHERLDYILRIPNLRRLSVSPWADEEKVKVRIGNTLVFSRKPNPAEVCVSFDETVIRSGLRKTLSIAGNGPLEIILKDTHTVNNQPWRISRWVEIARYEIAQYKEKN